MQYTFIHSNIRIVMCRIRSGKRGHFVLHKNGWLLASWGDLQSAVWPWGRVTLVVAKIGWLTTYKPASRVINKKKHIHVSWFNSCLKIAWYAYLLSCFTDMVQDNFINLGDQAASRNYSKLYMESDDITLRDCRKQSKHLTWWPPCIMFAYPL